MRNVLSQVLFVVSVASIVVAIALSGGSLGKSVKWNLYDSITYFCDPNSGFEFKLYGYQTLWSSYDAVNDDSTKYLNVYLVHAKGLLHYNLKYTLIGRDVRLDHFSFFLQSFMFFYLYQKNRTIEDTMQYIKYIDRILMKAISLKNVLILLGVLDSSEGIS